MQRHWFQLLPKRWVQEQAIASRLLTHVVAKASVRSGRAEIAGTWTLRHKYSDAVRDSFRIRVVYPIEFLDPFPIFESRPTASIPRVYLDSHRGVWTQTIDAHILRDWSLCLFVPGEAPIDFRWPDSLERLIAIVALFLMHERIFQRDLRLLGAAAKWPGKERSHGVRGLWEAVRDRGGMSADEPCICGSGLSYDFCCATKIENFTLNREAA